jgi:hypothetical protein
MISIPLSATLLLYAAVVGFFAVLAVVNVMHLVRYGATTRVSFIITFLFLAGAAVILFATWQLLAFTDWTQPISVSLPAFSFSPTSFTP